jgi:hypothetical protein
MTAGLAPAVLLVPLIALPGHGKLTAFGAGKPQNAGRQPKNRHNRARLHLTWV